MKRRSFLVLLILVVVGASADAGTNALDRIRQDEKSGRISRLQTLEYQFCYYFGRDLLPARYRDLPEPARPVRSLTPLIRQLREEWEHVSEPVRKLYREAADLPKDALTHTSAGGRIQIYYYTSGRHAVPDKDNNGNNVPDYVEVTAQAFEDVWDVEITQMGYREPDPHSPTWASAGDRNKYKVSLTNLTTGVYGYTWETRSGVSFTQLRNDYEGFVIYDWKGDSLNDYGKNPNPAIEVTAAHEFFHALQVRYVSGYSRFISWYEGSAVYMEETLYPHVNDYFQYVQDWFNLTHQSLHHVSNNGEEIHHYASCMWPIYLGKRYGHEMVRSVFEKMDSLNAEKALVDYAYNAMEAALRAGGFSLSEAYREFAVWCHFTRSRADTAEYFPDAHLYPFAKIHDSITHLRTVDSIKGKVDLMAFQYLRIQPDGVPARSIYFYGRNEYGTRVGTNWEAAVITHDSANPALTQIIPFPRMIDGVAEVKVFDWNRMSNVYLVVVNANQSNLQEFIFELAPAEFDTLRIAAGADTVIVKPRSGFRLDLTLTQDIESVFEFAHGLINPDTAGAHSEVSYEQYYRVIFTPGLEGKISHGRVTIAYDSADMAVLEGKHIRTDQLAAYVWDSTAGIWVRVGKVFVGKQDSVMTFEIEKGGIYTVLGELDSLVAFRSYPSPADFRKHRQVYFDMKQGYGLWVYSAAGALVRHLEPAQESEYDVNRFIWDGRDEKGQKTSPGLFYFVARDSSGYSRGKMMVLQER